MRFRFALLLLFATVAFASAQNSLKTVEKFRFNSADYIRVKDWCEVINFTPHWIRKDDELQITNRSWRINFTLNSIKCLVNGMDIRLSLPVIQRNGFVHISLVDVQTTIHPVLFAPRPSENKINVICLDAGHGGRDKGKIDKTHYEKKYTLLLAEELAKLLKQAGFKVIMTRTKDVYPELPDRIGVANRNNADLFLSLHYNAAANKTVRGVETYCMTPAGVESSNSGGGTSGIGGYAGNANDSKNMLLAYEIQKSILRKTGAYDRGIKRARFAVLQNAKMPAVLIEAGFMTNSDEAKKIYDYEYRKKMAVAIVSGIVNYKQTVESSAK